jgi:CRISPR/Cas system CSM-associated protein Csm2 small subunit
MVNFIGEGNRSTRRKPPSESLTSVFDEMMVMIDDDVACFELVLHSDLKQLSRHTH